MALINVVVGAIIAGVVVGSAVVLVNQVQSANSDGDIVINNPSSTPVRPTPDDNECPPGYHLYGFSTYPSSTCIINRFVPESIDLGIMDNNTDPCVDFEQAMCGKFIDWHTEDGSQSIIDRSFYQDDYDSDLLTENIMELETNRMYNAKTDIHRWMSACVRSTQREDIPGESFEASLLDYVDGTLNSLADLGRVLGRLHQYQIWGPWSFEVVRDYQTGDTWVASVQQGGSLAVGHGDFTLPSQSADLQYLAGMLGSSTPVATANDVSDLEIFIMNLWGSSGSSNIYEYVLDGYWDLHTVFQTQLSTWAPNVNWGLYWFTLGELHPGLVSAINTAQRKIWVYHPDFFEGFSEALTLGTFDVATWRWYLKMAIAARMQAYLPAKYASFRIHSAFEDETEPPADFVEAQKIYRVGFTPHWRKLSHPLMGLSEEHTRPWERHLTERKEPEGRYRPTPRSVARELEWRAHSMPPNGTYAEGIRQRARQLGVSTEGVPAVGSGYKPRSFNDVNIETQSYYEEQMRWKEDLVFTASYAACSEMADTNVPFWLNRWFVETWVPGGEEALLRVKDMTEQIVHEFEELIAVSSYSTQTKAALVEKAQHVVGVYALGNNTQVLGFDYEKLTTVLDRDSHALNVFNMRKLQTEEVLNRLLSLDPAGRTEPFLMRTTETNAYYVPTSNQITILGGILRPPFFHVQMDELSIYAALGSVLGHELSHGFDDTGVLFDKFGRPISVITGTDYSTYQTRSQCYVNQYTAPTRDGVMHDGQRTLGENIADNVGIALAFGAYDRHFGFNSDDEIRRFFGTFAQMWCAYMSVPLQEWWVDNAVHSLPTMRVNKVMGNHPEFKRVFECSNGDPMVNDPPCNVFS